MKSAIWKEANTTWYHLYMVSKEKEIKLIETESRKVVTRGRDVGEIGRGW